MCGTKRVLGSVCAAVALAVLVGPSFAEPPQPDFADTLVRQALAAESKGDLELRTSLLQQATAVDADYAPARWNRGELRIGGAWVPFETAHQHRPHPELSAKYRAEREKLGTTYADQMALADWCRDHKLPQRERAHLTAALTLAKSEDVSLLRKRLGQVLVGDKWVSRDEVHRAALETRRAARDFKTWRHRIKSLRAGYLSPNKSRSEQARKELLAIEDPAALPALEAVLSHQSLETAHLLVEILSGMRSHQAADFLARQAVHSRFATVREAATEQLKRRRPEQYAPELLAALKTPLASRVSVLMSPRGRRVIRSLSRETQKAHEVARMITRVDYQFVYGGTVNRYGNADFLRDRARLARERRIADDLERYTAERDLTARNERTEELNGRVIGVLQTATGQRDLSSSQQWWQWWYEFNQVRIPEEKPVLRYDRTQRITQTVIRPRVASCLVAGTTVWTDRGPLVVEAVQIGDLVLSKDVESGELTYKPVVQTTVRDPQPLFQVEAGETSFAASGGHRFWVSGAGWRMLSELQPGVNFHTADGFVPVESVTQSGKAKVYNLVVADAHTYFVGTDKLLSQDTTIPEPTDVTVPGLRPVWEE